MKTKVLVSHLHKRRTVGGCCASYAAYFLHLPLSHEKIVATSKHFCQVKLFLLLSLSPQPYKAQGQSCKSIFQLQMKKNRRLQQIYDYKRRNNIKLNSSTMHRALHCICFLKFPLFSFPSLLITVSFSKWTWPLLPFLSHCWIKWYVYSPVFAKHCLSCPLIFSFSISTLSVYYCLRPHPVRAKNLFVGLVVA